MNSKFAYLLQTAVNNKKLNSGVSVTKFIEKHGTTPCSLEEVTNTPEINDFLKVFYQKRIKCSDKQLDNKFSNLFSNIEVKTKPKKVSETYRAQEY
jgi:hypothetical protein